MGEPYGKKPLGRPRRKWEDNIKMDLREASCDAGDSIDLTQGRDQWQAYVKAVMKLVTSNNYVQLIGAHLHGVVRHELKLVIIHIAFQIL